MQTKLDHFFTRKVSPKPNKNKKCFIYDPEKRLAYFTENASESDRFICAKSGLELYYRVYDTSCIKNIKNIKTPYNIPLLKSNLQKAVRRKDVESAVQTSEILLQTDPTSFLRRLPIIFIEDVCLTDAFPIVVWMMMADKDYKLKEYDKGVLLSIVSELCEIDEWYDTRGDADTDEKYTHESLQYGPNSDCLLSLYYRMLYGGMKGDMKMLYNAIGFYRDREICKMKMNVIDHINLRHKIIPEAIDYHPYPYLLTYITKHTDIPEDRVKELIWYAESGLNERKPYTIENSEKYKEMTDWKMIKPFLDQFRNKL
jgi:hypothetical protein